CCPTSKLSRDAVEIAYDGTKSKKIDYTFCTTARNGKPRHAHPMLAINSQTRERRFVQRQEIRKYESAARYNEEKLENASQSLHTTARNSKTAESVGSVRECGSVRNLVCGGQKSSSIELAQGMRNVFLT